MQSLLVLEKKRRDWLKTDSCKRVVAGSFGLLSLKRIAPSKGGTQNRIQIEKNTGGETLHSSCLVSPPTKSLSLRQDRSFETGLNIDDGTICDVPDNNKAAWAGDWTISR